MNAPTFTRVECLISATFTFGKPEMKGVAYSNSGVADQLNFPFTFPLNIFLPHEPVETFIIRIDTAFTFKRITQLQRGNIGSGWARTPGEKVDQRNRLGLPSV